LRITLPAELRDPWTAAGLALLLTGTAAVGAVYLAAPQSVAEAAAGAGAAARPSSYAAHRARAEERLRAGEEAAASGRDTLASAAFAQAAEAGARARDLAGAEPDRAAAVDLWARATLGQAEVLRRAGTGSALKADDNDTLRRGLALVETVLASTATGQTRVRAGTLRANIQRQLRPGPLEWLPN
jgi:hypothetical protein